MYRFNQRINIKELISGLEEYDVVYIKGPDGETYASDVTEELGAFFENLESADDSIKLYIETRDWWVINNQSH